MHNLNEKARKEEEEEKVRADWMFAAMVTTLIYSNFALNKLLSYVLSYVAVGKMVLCQLGCHYLSALYFTFFTFFPTQVIDRVCLVVFTIFTVLTTAIVFYSAPHIIVS